VCSYNNAFLAAGRYATLAAISQEVPGCGAEGRTLQVWYWEDGARYAGPSMPWPVGVGDITIDVAVTGADIVADAELGTFVNGALVDADGGELPVGTTVEAFIGEALCASFVISPVVMIFEQGDAYGFAIPPEDAAPGCIEGEQVSFRVDGEPVEGSLPHDLASHIVDIRVP
jgi:hypothetical protein